ncbi:MAG: cbb3-type cytochrome c oxidase N-terminal domain-containing protein [Fulvivirga sp.]
MKNKWLRLLLALPLLGVITQANAQEAISNATTFYIVSGFVLVAAILVLVVTVVILQVLRTIINREIEEKAAAAGEPIVEEESWWKKVLTKANDAVPIEKEEEIVLDHNYDGIRELDNHLPPWWKWMFYASIVFAVVYMAIYHVFGTMPLQTEEYQAEMAIAEEARLTRLADQPLSDIDETNVQFVEDEAALIEGQKIFNRNCAACHKEDGGGGIGPNLTDQYWIHGGSIQDVFLTIKQGVPDKGMIAWKDMLTPDQMQNVSSYILTMQGTTPAVPKEPQGELYVPEVMESDSTQVASDSTQLALETN